MLCARHGLEYPGQMLVSPQRLDVNYRINEEHFSEVPPTPAARRPQPARSRRRVKCEESSSSDEDDSPTSVVPSTIAMSGTTRSQRASKTAALTKMTASRVVQIAGDDIEEEEDSGLTSEGNSDDSE